jgi:hypothetical protein
MSEETKVQVSIGIPPVAVGIDVPVELRRWFRWGKKDIIAQLYKDAWREDKVSLKICSYTLQTTLADLLRLFGKLEKSNRFPDVELKILRPDLTKPLKIWNKNNPNDRQYWDAKRKDAIKSDEVLDFIIKLYPGVKHKKQFFPFDPCLKAIIANDRVAFFGLYVVEKHQKTDQPGLTALDYLGTKTVLIKISAGGVLEKLIGWFDKTWETLTERRDET